MNMNDNNYQKDYNNTNMNTANYSNQFYQYDTRTRPIPTSGPIQMQIPSTIPLAHNYNNPTSTANNNNPHPNIYSSYPTYPYFNVQPISQTAQMNIPTAPSTQASIQSTQPFVPNNNNYYYANYDYNNYYPNAMARANMTNTNTVYSNHTDNTNNTTTPTTTAPTTTSTATASAMNTTNNPSTSSTTTATTANTLNNNPNNNSNYYFNTQQPTVSSQQQFVSHKQPSQQQLPYSYSHSYQGTNIA
jgi:hypothetical protein